jgi:poly-gamma-glutamate synthesis protein (capsule biosynthesis protein)
MKKLLSTFILAALFMGTACSGNSSKKDCEAKGDSIVAPAETHLTLLVAGDLMQHGPQINAARRANGTYDYSDCFTHVKKEISAADLAIANFEVTLGGPPYKGYPCFSAPDEYFRAILDAGFDVLTTGNNHCIDTGKRGLERTIQMMDSLHVPHLGTYVDKAARDASYPLLVEKNGFRIVLLNFTYATNGLVAKAPNLVNYIDTVQIADDIEKAKTMKPDLIIAIPHWGVEYAMTPAHSDVQLANWLLKKGVDHIIGGHPHVLQPFEWRDKTNARGGNVVAYSLGNFISNQFKPNTGIGAMIKLQFTKKGNDVHLDSCAYALTWTSRPQTSGQRNYRIVPVATSDNLLNGADRNRRDTDARTARRIFQQHNKDIEEYNF